jgi:hypothetical protein
MKERYSNTVFEAKHHQPAPAMHVSGTALDLLSATIGWRASSSRRWDKIAKSP